MRACRVSVVRTLLLLFFFAVSAGADTKFRPVSGGIRGEYIVVLNDVPGTDTPSLAADVARTHGVPIRETWTRALKGFWIVAPEAKAKSISADPRVRYVEQNVAMYDTAATSPQNTNAVAPEPSGSWPTVLGNHPLWHLWRLSHRTRSEPQEYVWDPSTSGSGVRVFVVDSGVLRFHQEFKTGQVKELFGSNVTDGDRLASSVPASSGQSTVCPAGNALLLLDDGSGRTIPYESLKFFKSSHASHGTSVGSLVAGSNTGVAKNAELVPIKAIPCNNVHNTVYFVRAFEWILLRAVESRQPSVVTMSTYRTVVSCQNWEGARCKPSPQSDATGYLLAMEEAVQSVLDDGLPVVASANNNNRDACHDTPGRLSRSGGLAARRGLDSGVITVGGLAKDADVRYSQPRPSSTSESPDGSNWGPCIDLWAPAERIASATTDASNAYQSVEVSGTSYAAPQVAGVIARMLSEDSSLRDDYASADPARRRGVPKRIWERLRDAATPFTRDALFGGDAELQSAVASNVITGSALYASPRRMLYMGAFSVAEQPRSIRLTGTRQTLVARPVGAPADMTVWYRDDNGAPVEVARLSGAGDHALCVQRATAGCQSPATNTRYWARLTRGGLSADSVMATVVVDKPIIVTHPASQWLPYNGSATLVVDALPPEGTTATYRWFSGFPEQRTDTGATTQAFPVVAATAHKGYFVEVTANGHTVTSDVAFVRVDAVCGPAPSVGTPTVTPLLGDVPPGQTFTVNATPGGTALEYHWYTGNKGDTTTRVRRNGQYVGGPVLTLTPGQYSKVWVRVYNKEGCAFADSEAVELTVRACDLTLEFSESAEDRLPQGGSRLVSVRARSGGNLVDGMHYTWYRENADGSLTRLPGYNLADVNLTPELGSDFRVLAIGPTCSRLSEKVHVGYDMNCAVPAKIPRGRSETYTVFRGQTLSFSFVTSTNNYQWLPGGSGFTQPEAVTCSTPCTAATRVATSSEFLRLQVSGHCTGNVFSWTEQSESIYLDVLPCGTNYFKLDSSRSTVTADGYTLQAPARAGSTYHWFKNGVKVAQGSSPTYETGVLAERTTFRVEISDPVCNIAPVTSQTLTIDPCLKPRPRAVRHPSSGTSPTVPSGTLVTLTVDDDHDGVTFAWFRGSSYGDTSEPMGEGPTITVTATSGSVPYWVRMTRICDGTPLTTDSSFFYVTGECAPTLVVAPAPATRTLAPLNQSTSITASVVAGGSGPFTYEWRDVTTNVLLASTPTYTWTYTTTAATPDFLFKDVAVTVRACGGALTSPAVRLSLVRYAQRASVDGDGAAYTPTQQQWLTISMDPLPSGSHTYTYEWFRDNGTPAGEKLSSTTSRLIVTTSSLNSYWCRITGTHQTAAGPYTEVSLSPKMYTWLYGTCELPPLKVTQSFTDVTGRTDPVTFVATCDWPGVKFEWYEGMSGDTRNPLTADAGKPYQLTVNSTTTRPYWVRVRRDCGGFKDSPTLTFTRGSCTPVLINQNVGSVTVAYGDDTSLYVDPISIARPGYTWYTEGSTTPIANAAGPRFDLKGVTASGRYYARVRNLDCSTGTDTFVATVRVASCPSITPPVWQTEIWTDSGTSKTLSAQSTGATRYQWFKGEVGGGTIILNETGATYNTGVLTADAKYWVRVFNDGCSIDSPTITVKVCVPPGPAMPLFLSQSIVANQTVRFSIDALGNDPTFQWFQGDSGVTTTPVGRPVDMLQVSPSVTTKYWVRVTGSCGVGGSNPRVYNSPTFTASVCPIVQSATAANATVMPNGTTTLTVSATGTGLTYQWYKGSPGDRTQPLPNGTGTTVTTPAITATTSFWCDVKSGNCTTSSPAVVVGLCSEPTVRWTHGDRSIAKGELVTFTAAATVTSGTPLYTFYKGTPGNVAASTVVKAETEYYWFSSVINETATYWVRARLGNCTADSTGITIKVCVPQIATQPLAGSITSGGSHTMTVVSDVTPENGYQWYIGESGVTTNPVTPNGTSASVTVSPAVDTKYWVRVKGCGTSKADSAAVLVSVCTKPDVTSSTSSHWVTKNDTRTLTVNATGTNLTYKWYRGAAGVTTTQIATTQSVNVTPTDSTQYWARVSNGCGTDDTPTITLSVCAPPVITVQPLSQPIFSGKTATLSVTATQATSTPMTYQWYSGTPGSGTILTGQTGTSYTTPALSAQASYYVRVTAGTCSTDSAAAVISMCSYNEVLNAPDDKDITLGQTVRLQVSPLSPSAESGRWYRGVQGDRTNLISSSTYADVAPAVTTQYWGEYVQGGCTSKTRTVTVYVSIPTITQQPVNSLAPPNGTTNLTVAANTAGVRYQWYQGTSGTGTLLTGATSATFTTPAHAAGTTVNYWVKVTGSRGHVVNSNTATVTWCMPAAITSHPASRNLQRGNSTWLTVKAVGTNLRYQWYRGESGVETYPLGTGSISNADGTSSLNVSPSNPEKYWVKVTSDCGSVNSNTCYVNVCVPPTITAQPVSQSIFSGTSATLSVSATAGTALPLSYQWYTAAGYDPIPGQTSSTFVTPALTAETTYYVEVISGSCRTSSEIVTVSMCAYNATINAPSDRDVYSAQATLLKVTLSPSPESVTWYRGVSGDRTTPISYSSQHTVYPTVTTQYWGEFTYGGCTATGRTVTANVCIPKITTQPASATIARNATKTLSVAASNATSYQWYSGTSAGYGTPISGATSSSFTTPPLTTTTSYWVRVNGSCNKPTDSVVATVTVQ